MLNFLVGAVDASLCQFFENWLMKLKFPNLKNIHTVTFQQNLTCIFLSVRVNLKETFQCETPCSKKRVNVAGEKKRTGLKNLAREANLASLMAT